MQDLREGEEEEEEGNERISAMQDLREGGGEGGGNECLLCEAART